MFEAQQFLTMHGTLVLFALVFASGLGLPVPGPPVLLAAGVLAGSGRFSLTTVLGGSLLALLLTDLLWYQLGRAYGRRILALLCRISLEPDSCVQRTETVFSRRQEIAIRSSLGGGRARLMRQLLAEGLLGDPAVDPTAAAAAFVDADKGVADPQAALEGARAILTERFSEAADLIGKHLCTVKDWPAAGRWPNAVQDATGRDRGSPRTARQDSAGTLAISRGSEVAFTPFGGTRRRASLAPSPVVREAGRRRCHRLTSIRARLPEQMPGTPPTWPVTSASTPGRG